MVRKELGSRETNLPVVTKKKRKKALSDVRWGIWSNILDCEQLSAIYAAVI